VPAHGTKILQEWFGKRCSDFICDDIWLNVCDLNLLDCSINKLNPKPWDSAELNVIFTLERL